ncbi:hypothetical protein CCP3SC1_150041 [Gammaproteobacteria bacterium]
MIRTSQKFAMIAAGFLIVTPVRASILDTEMLLLLTGPVSEAVQETVLLIRRGDNFISSDSLIIGCIAGASAGIMVSVAPALGFMANGVATSVGIGYVIGASILSCGMSMVSGAAGMATSSFLKELRVSPKTPLTQ